MAGTSYMLTRRITQRLFLLRPDDITREHFVYCFALAAKRHNIEVHWLMVMSNHYHAGIRDVEGNVPAFARDFHGLLARSMNAARGRWENLWATEETGMLELAGADAVLDKLGYGLTNPCAAHLVDKVNQWPGVCSYRNMMTGAPMKARRPWRFFSRSNKRLPDEVELQFVRPPQFAELSEEQWCAKIQDVVRKEEAKLAKERADGGIKLVGRKAVRRQSAFSQPKTIAERRGLHPRVASKNKWLRIAALRRNQAFQERYREAWERYRAGDRAVLFPYGTYKLHRMGHVQVEPPPLAA